MLQRRLLATGTALLLSILTYICTIALIQPSIVSAHAYVINVEIQRPNQQAAHDTFQVMLS